MNQTVRESETVGEGGRYFAEGSSLGWAPGHWPTVVAFEANDGAREMVVGMIALRNADGEIVEVEYYGRGIVLSVAND